MKIFILVVLVLAGCGGGSEPEVELQDYQQCRVRSMDNKCPANEVEHKVPHFSELLKENHEQ